MPDYSFYKKLKHVVVVESQDAEGASQLYEQGYKKQFEEIRATDKNRALSRFADIRREKRIDHHNFMAGAGTMPLIGVLTAIACFLLRKK